MHVNIPWQLTVDIIIKMYAEDISDSKKYRPLPFLTGRFLIFIRQGGSVIRLFHKELEAMLVAEGLFDDEITEDGK